MVSVNTSASVLTASNVASQQKKSSLDYNAFLKLLVAQMKNQDPTKPMESTEYMAQLASFSNVEQSINANKKLDSLLQQTRIAQGAGLIGRHVSSLDGLGAGTVESVRFGQSTIIAGLSDGSEIEINDRVVIEQ
jgi:flagellar basal-body rod modification protein FlgD